MSTEDTTNQDAEKPETTEHLPSMTPVEVESALLNLDYELDEKYGDYSQMERNKFRQLGETMKESIDNRIRGHFDKQKPSLQQPQQET